MAKRWPPTLGITGFDGGFRPAIALVVEGPTSRVVSPESESSLTCDAPTITVSFSGVTICSGCLDATPFGFSYSIDNLIATGVIDDTFTLNSFGGPLCDGTVGWFFTTPDNRINYDQWASSGCVGLPDSNLDEALTAYAKCSGGVFELWLFGASSAINLFYATGITSFTGIANGNGSCAGTIPDPNDPCFPPVLDFVVGGGGTATITS